MKNELREMLREHLYQMFNTLTRERLDQVIEQVKTMSPGMFSETDIDFVHNLLVEAADGEALYPASTIDPAIDAALEQVAHIMAKNFAESMLRTLLLQKMADNAVDSAVIADTPVPPRYMN